MTKPQFITQNRPWLWPVEAEERLRLYRGYLGTALAHLKRGALVTRLPGQVGLRQKRHGQPFHPTPELFFQQAGETIFRMPAQTIRLRAGEALVMPAGVPHGETTVGGPGYLTMVVMFQPTGFSLHFGQSTPRHGVLSHPIDYFVSANPAGSRRLIDEMSAQPTAGTRLAGDYVNGLWQAWLALSQSEVRAANETPAAPTRLTDRARSLVTGNLSHTQLNVKWLGAQLGCTADHLSRVFRRETGRRLIDEILDRRIELAKSFLEHSDFNIGETAWSCGFATQSYFNRIFASRTGQTPGQYRRSLGHALPST